MSNKQGRRGPKRLLSKTLKKKTDSLLEDWKTLPIFQRGRECRLAWLAGLIDGEGCVYLGISTRQHTAGFIDCHVGIEMTHKLTIEHAAAVMREISKDPVKIKKRDRIGGTKRQYSAHTSSQLGALQLLMAVCKYLVTKRLESLLIIDYLSRAAAVGHYKVTAADRKIARCVKRLKRYGYNRAEIEARRLLDRNPRTRS